MTASCMLYAVRRTLPYPGGRFLSIGGGSHPTGRDECRRHNPERMSRRDMHERRQGGEGFPDYQEDFFTPGISPL